MDYTSRKDLFDDFILEIKILKLDIKDARGQGYDNGSNMKRASRCAKKRKKKLLEINP